MPEMDGPLDSGQRNRAKNLWNRNGDDVVRIEGILFSREGDVVRAEVYGEQLGDAFLLTSKTEPVEFENWVNAKIIVHAGNRRNPSERVS